MDHLSISNTVDSTGTLRVAGVATPVILFGFLSLVHGKATEKIGYKKFSTFLFLLWAYASTFYLSLQKVRIVFFCIRDKSVFSSV